MKEEGSLRPSSFIPLPFLLPAQPGADTELPFAEGARHFRIAAEAPNRAVGIQLHTVDVPARIVEMHGVQRVERFKPQLQVRRPAQCELTEEPEVPIRVAR